MPLHDLEPGDQAVIRDCLRFVLESGELDGEFLTRMGVTEAEVRAILAVWPNVDDAADDSPIALAINNAMNEVCHGIRQRVDWHRWFSVTVEEVRVAYRRWAELRGWTLTGIR